MKARLVLLFGVSLPFSAVAQTDTPTVSGYVTAVGASGTFDINSFHIQPTPATGCQIELRVHPVSETCAPVIGKEMKIYGKYVKRSHSIKAEQIVLIPPDSVHVKGAAIIELATAGMDPDRTLRADGYMLKITPKTAISFTPPLASIGDLAVNQWIVYEGVRGSDGIVVVDKAAISKNEVRHREDKLREKHEYDPAAVDPEAKQNGVSKAFRGVDTKLIPPYRDAAMQARVDRIGARLVPAFQRTLPGSDPSRINFRFQLIDAKHWHDALTLPNGIILVPYQVVERMQNDSQLATVLADNIAEAYEKDDLRLILTSRKLLATEIAGSAAGIAIPGAGIATYIAAHQVVAHAISLQLQQSGRVSLFLLQDAGFDITQAPLAWWLLAPEKPRPINKIPLPPRAANLYLALGTTWRPAQHL